MWCQTSPLSRVDTRALPPVAALQALPPITIPASPYPRDTQTVQCAVSSSTSAAASTTSGSTSAASTTGSSDSVTVYAFSTLPQIARIVIEYLAGDLYRFTVVVKHNGMVGIGFPSSALNYMLGSDAIIGWGGASASVDDYKIGTAKTPDCAADGICLDTAKGGRSDITGASASTDANGVTTIVFTRKRDTGDALDYVLASPGNYQTVLVALGGSQAVSYHSSFQTAVSVMMPGTVSTTGSAPASTTGAPSSTSGAPSTTGTPSTSGTPSTTGTPSTSGSPASTSGSTAGSPSTTGVVSATTSSPSTTGTTPTTTADVSSSTTGAGTNSTGGQTSGNILSQNYFGLPMGALIGIGIGALIIIAVIIVLSVKFCKKKSAFEEYY
jgi:hypothetical protein